MTEWKIQPRSHACQACGKVFADKGPYYTLLFDKRHSLDRLDVCPACWENQYGQGANDRKGFVSFWQGVFTVPPPPPPEPIQKDSAESLLRKLVESNDPAYQAACFILAVMLERKRVFKVKTQSFEDGHRVLCYEHAKNGDLFTIMDPALQLHQLDEVQRQVAELLEHGLPAETPLPVTADIPPPTPAEPAGAPAIEPAKPEAEATPTVATPQDDLPVDV